MNNTDTIKKVPSKHRCLDCNKLVHVSRRELWRSSRPRCYGCGSSRLEPIVRK